MVTRTYVMFFSEEALKEMGTAYQKLVDDYTQRSSYMSKQAERAISGRLDIIAHAIDLLAEPVPESYE